MNVLEELDGIVAGKLAVLKTFIALIRLESKLAGLSVYPLLLNICLLLIVLMTVWATGTLLLGYSFFLICHNVLIAIGIVFLLNLAVVFGLFKYLSSNLRQMSFEKTRQYLLQREGGKDDQ